MFSFVNWPGLFSGDLSKVNGCERPISGAGYSMPDAIPVAQPTVSKNRMENAVWKERYKLFQCILSA